MDDTRSIFEEPAAPKKPESPPIKEPSFFPYIAAAVTLIAIWGVMEFVLPGPSQNVPASVLMKNAAQHFSEKGSASPSP
ncbi:hypothetical protein [Acetobacter sp.]|uniref:hypothetical protein n=1 Tax=Acetobacter sp. TaxID=440 RepID=UPI0039ED98FC